MVKKNGAALITGSAKRIGREMAILLAKKGYDIAICYNKSLKEAQNLAREISQNFAVECMIFHSDLKDQKASLVLIDEVIKKFPNLNLLINNASIFNKSKFLTGPDSELFDNLNLHLISPLFLSKEFAKNIEERNIKNAHIINMIDKNIARFDTNYFYYLLSKKFLAEFTKMLALELAPSIRVNAIAPGFILNSIDEENPSQETQKLIARIPLKNQGEIKNILQTLDFLLENNFMTGQLIFVDGGASLNHAG